MGRQRKMDPFAPSAGVPVWAKEALGKGGLGTRSPMFGSGHSCPKVNPYAFPTPSPHRKSCEV